jgi:hypothetical protein
VGRAVGIEVTILASQRFPGRGYAYAVEEGETPNGFIVFEGKVTERRRGWPPPEDPGPHLVVGVMGWVPGPDSHETYEVRWRAEWGSCD